MKQYLYLTPLLSILCLPSAIHADPITILGGASTFAVLGSSTVTNTGSTHVTGDVGVSPGSSITGFPAGMVSGGSIHVSDALAIGAQLDAQSAYTYLGGLAVSQDLSGQDLGGSILTPGVYSFSSSAQLTGILTIDFLGLNNADIVIRTGSTFVTANDSQVAFINQGTDDNVYYVVGSSATLGTYSTMQGHIIADASITMTTGASLTCGSLMAMNGAVTLDTNDIQTCSTSGSGGTTTDPSVTPVPEPSSLALLATGLTATMAIVRRRCGLIV